MRSNGIGWPPMGYEGPSKKQVEKAGSKLRRWHRGEPGYGAEQLAEARDVLRAYRSEFSRPLLRINARLRKRLESLDVEAYPTQRLKKLSTIVDKLTTRETSLSPWLMGDIGGCRIILEDLSQLRSVQSSLEQKWKGGWKNSSDYVNDPRPSGYRAVHCYLSDITTGLTVEVQLRTPLMHSWAQDVEDVSGALGINYKQDGDSEYHQYMAQLSKVHDAIETGKPIPEYLRATLRAQRAQVAHSLNLIQAGGTRE